jgi:hypothetical protein
MHMPFLHPLQIASHPWVMTHLTSSRRAITTSCPGEHVKEPHASDINSPVCISRCRVSKHGTGYQHDRLLHLCTGDESGVQPEDGAPDAGEGLPGAQGQVPELLQRMRAFSQMNELRREALKVRGDGMGISWVFACTQLSVADTARIKDCEGNQTAIWMVQ